MRFGVLGPLAVWTVGGDPVRIVETKVRALLAHLLLDPGRPVSADALIEHLWGGSPPADPAAALRTRVSQLRRALGKELVGYSPAGYLLRVDGDAVDAGRFEALVGKARAADDPGARADLLTEALALWRGPAFADVADEPFARAAVVRLEEQRLAAVEEQAEARLELGEHDALAAELAGVVARHPLRERLRAVHLLALYRAGRQGDALTDYDELRTRLADELGASPGPELAALHQAILRQDPVLEAAAPVAPSRVPVPFTQLIGREDAVGEVRALLAGGRLVTLVGPGGVGKTRLALEAAHPPDVVHVVELAALPPGEDAACTLAEVVATALGIRDDGAGAGSPVTRLADALSHRRMLLVLDNCEHVAAPLAGLVDELLRAAPGLRVLATSREPLGLAGERLYLVPPLDVPEDGGDERPESLLAFSAVRLFVARAAAAAPGFVLDEHTAGAVTAICRRLDGLPLALELAATRVRGLGVHELARRLDQRFQLLAAGRRGGPSRQQSLRAVIDWSWELLTTDERVVLRRLAVHVDGCTLAAAEAVSADEVVPAGSVVGVLVRLVDRSLVSVVEGPDGPRYRLLESVGAYCVERLREAGEAEHVRERHRRHYTALAERIAPQLRGAGQGQGLRQLDAETANLRAALDDAVRAGAAEAAHRLVNALVWYWVLRGRLGEARRSLTAALDTAGAAPARAATATWRAAVAMRLGDENGRAEAPASEPGNSPDERSALAGALWYVGHASIGFGPEEASLGPVDRALALFRESGDRWGIAAALCSRARQALGRGDLAALRADGEHSRTLFRELGDGWGEMQAGFVLGVLAQITGDYARAARLHRGAVRTAEELGMWTDVSDNLCQLGRLALLTGDLAGAERLHDQARRLAAEQGYTVGEEFAEIGIALGARRRGDLDRAEPLLRKWLQWDTAMQSDPGAALILAELGFIAELRGDAESASAIHTEGLIAARKSGDPRAVALALEGLAGAHAIGGDRERAARLLAEAAATRAAAGAPLPPAERGDVDRIITAVSAAP
ncbi:winged helix-turn-helix domain-containing protein [Pseudonocardia sp. DSM 110487]|uniref:BTAD domain-containing putative transcriptional regulator n=1 Tax=Pseudonocardia sp. DSM 110487 TaxID=2865833 RepID=UPI001C69C4E9|nr:BTAD domain-containing putative transcriptional regulator [Pseudonocardia sp. DSM 110487]QYN35418.1 winged helix-turn-helix domain-containing protein [Pseudonocardia sp. DSM 110487]